MEERKYRGLPEWIFGDPKEKVREGYERINEILPSDVIFLNYGYSPFERPYQPVNWSPLNSTQLLLEVLLGIPIESSSKVLEVGCGRGGNIALIQKIFNCHAVGLDLCSSSVKFARHQHPECYFCEADAENMNLNPEGLIHIIMQKQFDVVLNIESSHAYTDLATFFREVDRVLKPGGYFLYADVFSEEDLIQLRPYRHVCTGQTTLFGPGEFNFRLINRRDITAGVVRSCQEIYPDLNCKLSQVEKLPFELPGSDSYIMEGLTSGRLKYELFQFKKLSDEDVETDYAEYENYDDYDEDEDENTFARR